MVHSEDSNVSLDLLVQPTEADLQGDGDCGRNHEGNVVSPAIGSKSLGGGDLTLRAHSYIDPGASHRVRA